MHHSEMNTVKENQEDGHQGIETQRHVLTMRQSSLDLIKEDPETEKPVTAPIVVEMEEDYLKVKKKPPPGINASLVFWYALMFTTFSIGCVNWNRCPLNRMIPIYLIVTGFLGAATRFLNKMDDVRFYNVSLLLMCIYVIWNLLGSFWVFKEYQPVYIPSESPVYCNRVAFLFSFWWLILQYTLFGFFVLLSLCYMMMRNDFNKSRN